MRLLDEQYTRTPFYGIRRMGWWLGEQGYAVNAKRVRRPTMQTRELREYCERRGWSLIVERVKAGLRNAKAKGKRLGRPKAVLDAKRIASLRAQGVGWKKIAADLGVGVGTIYRFAGEGSKIRERDF
jgi:hypothetical protein